MAFWYPVSYCLCFGPIYFVITYGVGFEVGKLFYGMNGFANALVYSCNSKYVCDESDGRSSCAAEKDLEAWSGLASFHAGFEKRVEVVEFSKRSDVSLGS